MSDIFDFQPAIEAIMNASDLVGTDGLLADQNRFDAGEHHGVFTGDVPQGVTLAGRRSFLVRGSLEGAEGNPCRIQVDGNVVVTGDVQHAHIRGRNISIGGQLLHSQLTSSGNIAVGSDMVHTRLLVGDYEPSSRRIGELKVEMERQQEQRGVLDRNIIQDERRLDRSCKTTRTPLNFGAGKIVLHRDGRVRVDLKSIFASFGNPSEERFKIALTEFFAKGIVGVLTKANLVYIEDNPARRKIFLQLLRNLRELFMLVVQRETVSHQVACDGEEIKRLVSELTKPNRTLCVQGNIRPDFQVTFMLPEVRHLDGGNVDIAHGSAVLKLHPGKEEGFGRLDLTDSAGEQSFQDLPQSALQDVSFTTSDGQIIRQLLSSAPSP